MLQRRDYNSNFFKPVYGSVISCAELRTAAYAFYTFDRKAYLNLYDGNVLDVESREFVSLVSIYSNIRNARNLEGYMIAKKKYKNKKLRKVSFVKKEKHLDFN